MPKIAPGLRFLPSRVRVALEARWLRQVERAIGCTIDVVWNFENSRFYDMRFAANRLKIYHQVDLDQNFNPDIAAKTSDLVIANSLPIEERLSSYARKMVRITHGCAQATSTLPVTNLLDAKPSAGNVNAVLVGNLDQQYLDVTLLDRLINEYSAVRFHFIGGYTDGSGLHAAVGYLPNVTFWGKRPATEIPGIISCADILLVAYLADRYKRQRANPHKLMEYLLSGRAILATETLEYMDRPDLVQIAANHEDYLQKFGTITSNLDEWNSADKVATRRAFALDNTYPRQVDRIAQALGIRGGLIS